MLPQLSFDIVLEQACWRTYKPTFDSAFSEMLCSYPDGRVCTVPLLPSRDNSLSLSSIKLASDLVLSEEFARFAPLFEPSTTVPSPEGNEHDFAFKFKENAVLLKGCPVYSTNLKAREALEDYVKDMLD